MAELLAARRPQGLLEWIKLGLAVAFGALVLYLVIVNAYFWLWVGDSAFRGIRAPRDVGLGIQCVAATGAPIAAGVIAFRRARRRSPTYHVPTAWAAAVALPVVFVTIVYGVLLSGPF